MRTHTKRTKRRTRNWQIVALLLAVGAATITVVDLTGFLGPGTAALAVASAAGRPEGPAGTNFSIEQAQRLADILDPLAGPRGMVQTPEPELPGPDIEVVKGPEPEKPVEAAPAATVTFIGSITTPNGKYAMLKSGDRQFMLREGNSQQGVKLVKVEKDHVMVEEGGHEKKVDLQPPMGLFAMEPGAGVGTTPRPGLPSMGLRGTPQQNAAKGAVNGATGNPAKGAPPAPVPVAQPSDERSIMVMRELLAPELDAEGRMNILRNAGIDIDNMTTDVRLNAVRAMGIDLNTQPRLYEQLKLDSDEYDRRRGVQR